MNSINIRAMSMTLVFLSLLPMVAIGECRSVSEEQKNANISRQAQVFPVSPIIVNDNSLDEALKIYSPLVLDCWEIGCQPCQLIEPKIDRMAEDFKGRIVFGKLCIDNNPMTMSKYGISRTPTLLIFNNGSLMHNQVGNFPQEELVRIIRTVLQMP